MARCRKCNAKIPDGKELCAECEQLNSESYLDSLLHTVAAKGQNAKDTQTLSMERMEEEIDPVRMEELEGEEVEKSDNFSQSDILSPPDISISQDLLSPELSEEEILPPEDFPLPEIGDFDQESFKEDAAPTQEDFSLPEIEDLAQEFSSDDMPPTQEDIDIPADLFLQTKDVSEIEDFSQDDMPSAQEDIDIPADLFLQTKDVSEIEDFSQDDVPSTQEDIDIPADLFLQTKDVPEIEESEGAEDNIDRMDTFENEIQGGKENDMAGKNDEDLKFGDGGETQEDILDLINSIYDSEESEFSGGEDVTTAENYGTQDDLDLSGQSDDDMTDFFADVLPDEEPPSIEESDILVKEPENDEEVGKKKKEKKKEKKEKKNPGILTRIFGNVRPERTEEEIAQMKEKVIADAEAKEAAEEEKKKKQAEEKEAKKKQAADDKAEAEKKKQEKAKRKAEAAQAKKEAKQLAKDKKKQEVQNLIDAIDENEGRINRVGAPIVFVFFAAIAIAIIIGTKVYAYSQNLENAKKSFEYKHYNEAYNEIAGMDIKEEDEEFELKVMVVMYAHKQLNSFQHYYAIGLYPEALDSLLKGLERHDKYSALASIINVTEDMDSIREEILNQLKTVYSLTEKEAMQLVAMDDHTAYTKKVYEIAGKIAKTPKEDTAEEKK